MACGNQSTLDLENVPEEILVQKACDKPPPFKRDRVSSSGRSESDESVFRSDINEIKESLNKTLQLIVGRKEIEEIVKGAMKEMTEEIKKDIKAELKQEIVAELQTEVEDKIGVLKTEFNDKSESLKTEFTERSSLLDEKCAGANLDIEFLRVKICNQEAELREMRKALKECETEFKTVKVMANFNQQYSQKNNVKILHWAEKRNEDLKSDLCAIVKQDTGVELDPRNILAIHRVPHGQRKSGPRPVVVKFINSETRISILRHRKTLKPRFTLIDHLTPLNVELLHRLNDHPKIENAWYFNARVFAHDCNGTKHKFDICDNIDWRLRNVRE